MGIGMKTVIIGDSHVNALREAAGRLSKSDMEAVGRSLNIGSLGTGSLALVPFCRAHKGRVFFSDGRYNRAFTNLTGGSHFQADVEYGVLFGFHSLPVVTDDTWRTSAPWRVAKKHGLSPVSSAVIDEMVCDNNQHIYELYEYLISFRVQFFVISAPPIRADHPFFKEVDCKLALAVDHEFRASASTFFRDRGVEVIFPPADVYDKDGFMRDDLARKEPKDFHHGNASYGEIMLRHILKIIARPGSSRPRLEQLETATTEAKERA
ncbi:hypothetical protein CN112_07070 [Sinorhizobium meliloti]|nr:hypothetical protein CN112_07070 [Sinorhizobium meliloti]